MMIRFLWLSIFAGCAGDTETETTTGEEPTPLSCVTRTWDVEIPGTLSGERAGRTEAIEVRIPTTGRWGFSTLGSAFDTVLALRTTCDSPALARNDDWVYLDSFVQADLEAGDVVIAEIEPFSRGEARFYQLSIFEIEDDEISCDDGFDNDVDWLVDCQDDSCADDPACEPPACPDDVVEGELPSTVETTVPIRTSGFEPSCIGWMGAPEVTWEFTAPESGDYVFDTLGSSYDTVLAVFDGCEGDELACNDDGPLDVTSVVVMGLEAEQVVLVVVDGYDPESHGDAVLSISRLPEEP